MTHIGQPVITFIAFHHSLIYMLKEKIASRTLFTFPRQLLNQRIIGIHTCGSENNKSMNNPSIFLVAQPQKYAGRAMKSIRGNLQSSILRIPPKNDQVPCPMPIALLCLCAKCKSSFIKQETEIFRCDHRIGAKQCFGIHVLIFDSFQSRAT